MSEQRPAHRSRRPQAASPIPMEEEKAALQPEERPHRIVAVSEDEPDWLVSATRVSGAAGRRTGAPRSEKSDEPEEKRVSADRRTQESLTILSMQKKQKAAIPPAAADDMQTPRRKAAPAADGEEQSIIPVIKKTDRKPAQRGARGKAASANAAPAPKAPRKKLSKKARARRNAQMRRIAVVSVAAVMLIAVMTAGFIGVSRLVDIKKTLDVGDGVFYPNISVNGIPLSGMTLDDAAAVVTRQVKAQISSWKITLRATDGSGRTWDITGDDLKMKYDVADQLDQLWAIGHTGSSSVRYEQVKKLQEEPASRYTTLTYDLSRVNQILTQIKTEVDKPPVSATRVDDPSKWPPYSYTDDTPGLELDISGLNEQICGMVDRLESGTVDLTPTPVQAPVTRAELEGRIVKLAEYETAIGATSDPGRFINIENGTKRFDKLIIKSGEQVSFNKVAGKRTYSNGYADAPELAYGDYRQGVGGGICQVSSTLYNAVVNAGLEIKTRYQHSLASNYVPLGLDATVQDDRLDFVFKNTTNADIYISTEYYKKKGYWYTKFNIHGRPDPNGYTYKLESEVVEELPVPEPTYIPDKNAEYVVYDDEMKQTSEGHEGHVVDVYLVTMDQKGLVISREKKYTDTYKPLTPKFYVGVTPRETPVPPEYGLVD